MLKPIFIFCLAIFSLDEQYKENEYLVLLEYKINGKRIDNKAAAEKFSFYSVASKMDHIDTPIDLYKIDSIVVSHNDTAISVGMDLFLPFVVNKDETNNDGISIEIEYQTLHKKEVNDSILLYKRLDLGNGTILIPYSK